MTTEVNFVIEMGEPVFALWAPVSDSAASIPRAPGTPSPPPPIAPRAPPTTAWKVTTPGATTAAGTPSLQEIENGHLTISTKRDFSALPSVSAAAASACCTSTTSSSSGTGGSTVSKSGGGLFGFLRRKDREKEREEQFVISTPSNFRQFDVRVEAQKLVATMTDESGQEVVSPEPNLQGIEELTQGSGGSVLGIVGRKKGEWVKPRTPQTCEYRNDLGALVAKMKEMDSKRVTDPDFVDYWSSRPMPLEEWRNAAVDVPKQVMDDVLAKGYHFEFGPQCVTDDVGGCNGSILLNMEEDHPYYADMFAKVPHENYLFPEVPAIVSVLRLATFAKVLLWTKKGVERMLISPDNITKTLRALPTLRDKKMVKVKNQERAVRELVDFEKLELHVASKFGLVYCRPYEQDEDSLFSARGGSREYDEFLDFIGTRVKLLGWDKYRGGLDVKANVTGTHSVYATVLRHEIMFHVCTMLPFVEEDEQKVERKRHIGNDVVVLVFKDQGDPSDLFNSAIFRSHFIHCVFVVTPVVGADGKTTHYRLFISNKPGVPPYPPRFPNPPGPDSNLFPKTPEFRDWLLLKMVNAGRAGLNSAEFYSLITARRQKLSFVCGELEQS